MKNLKEEIKKVVDIYKSGISDILLYISCIAFTTNFLTDVCIPRLLEKVVDVNSDSFSSFNTLFTNVKYVVLMSPFIYYTLNPCFVKIFYEFDRI